MMKKDIELLKYKLEGLQEINMRMREICEPNSEEQYHMDGSLDAIDRALEFVDHLDDDDETLSQEWIEEHVTAVTYDEILDRTETVYVVDLENLLIPKRELPAIPDYVADWITIYREKYDLYPALRLLENNTFVWGEIYEWYRMNAHKFVNAYLTGEYEVEHKPLYHALIKGHEVSNSCDIYWNYDKYDGDVFVSRLYPTHDNFLTEMSKLEWVKLGINDSNADFVEVEE